MDLSAPPSSAKACAGIQAAREPSVAALISVIVTTYNREDALAAVLRSLRGQTDPDFEVIVADDGSGPATAALVEAAKATSAIASSMSGTRTRASAPARSATAPCGCGSRRRGS